MNSQAPEVLEPKAGQEVQPKTEEAPVEERKAEEVNAEEVKAKEVKVEEVKVEEVKVEEVREERTWTEEIELAGSQLVEKFKELVAEGNVRRLILRTPDDSLLIEIPLVAGAVVGGVVTIFALPLAILGAIASLLAKVKVEIVRVDEEKPQE